MADTNLVRGKDYIKIEDGRTSYWFAVEHVIPLLWYPLIGRDAYVLYTFLCSLATKANGNRGDVEKIRVEDLAALTGMNKDYVGKARNVLKDMKFISVHIPPKTKQGRGNASIYRILDTPREVTTAHVYLSHKHGVLKEKDRVATVQDYFDKKIVAKWLIGKADDIDGDIDWQPAAIDELVQETGIPGSNLNHGKYESEPAKPDFRTSNIDRDRDKHTVPANPADVAATGDATSDTFDLAASQPNDETGSITNRYMNATQFAEQRKQHQQRVIQHAQTTGDTVARDATGRRYIGDMEPDDVARVALATLSTIKGKSVDYVTEKQYAQLRSERMTLKDGRTMHPPAWYMQRYSDQYRAYIEQHVPRQFENLDKMKVQMSNLIKILLHPDWYYGWLNYMHRHGLSDGLPLTTAEAGIAAATYQPTTYPTDDITPAWVSDLQAGRIPTVQETLSAEDDRQMRRLLGLDEADA